MMGEIQSINSFKSSPHSCWEVSLCTTLTQGWSSPACHPRTIGLWRWVCRGNIVPAKAVGHAPLIIKCVSWWLLKFWDWRKEIIRNYVAFTTSMGVDWSGPFMMSLIKMKLTRSTTFAWQRHTQGNSDVPHCAENLEFINLLVRTSKVVPCHCPKCHSQHQPSNTIIQIRTAYVENVDTDCMPCNVQNTLCTYS